MQLCVHREGQDMTSSASPDSAARDAIAWLKAHGSEANRAGMARYNIPSGHAFGVPMSDIQRLAKQLGRHHELAAQLWKSEWYEARTLAPYVEEVGLVSAAQMDRWCKGFDNWAICDTVCFALFDRTPHAWSKVAQWAGMEQEYVRRAAFATLWGLTVHDKAAGDERYTEGLRLIEQAAGDERHFVKKVVNMALRAVGKRNLALNAAAIATAQRLAASPDAAPRWIGKNALAELNSASVKRRVGR
jgi:3-methyladenine DNA glycosylase AlkD